MLAGFCYEYNEEKGIEMTKYLFSQNVELNFERSKTSNILFSLCTFNLTKYTE